MNTNNTGTTTTKKPSLGQKIKHMFSSKKSRTNEAKMEDIQHGDYDPHRTNPDYYAGGQLPTTTYPAQTYQSTNVAETTEQVTEKDRKHHSTKSDKHNKKATSTKVYEDNKKRTQQPNQVVVPPGPVIVPAVVVPLAAQSQPMPTMPMQQMEPIQPIQQMPPMPPMQQMPPMEPVRTSQMQPAPVQEFIPPPPAPPMPIANPMFSAPSGNTFQNNLNSYQLNKPEYAIEPIPIKPITEAQQVNTDYVSQQYQAPVLAPASVGITQTHLVEQTYLRDQPYGPARKDNPAFMANLPYLRNDQEYISRHLAEDNPAKPKPFRLMQEFGKIPNPAYAGGKPFFADMLKPHLLHPEKIPNPAYAGGKPFFTDMLQNPDPLHPQMGTSLPVNAPYPAPLPANQTMISQRNTQFQAPLTAPVNAPSNWPLLAPVEITQTPPIDPLYPRDRIIGPASRTNPVYMQNLPALKHDQEYISRHLAEDNMAKPKPFRQMQEFGKIPNPSYAGGKPFFVDMLKNPDPLHPVQTAGMPYEHVPLQVMGQKNAELQAINQTNMAVMEERREIMKDIHGTRY